MIALLFSLPLAAPPVAPVLPQVSARPAASAVTADAADSVLRVYDLSSIDWGGGAEWRTVPVSLLPGVDFWESPKEGSSEDEDALDVSRALNVVYRLLEDEFQYEGRFLEETGTGRLLVSGPDALHQRIELLLEYLASVVHAGAELSIDVWSLPAANQVPEVASIAPGAEIDAWTASLRSAGASAEHYEVFVRPDAAAVLKMTTDVHAIVDYDVEIAQAATISDPILATATVGTRLSIGAVPSDSGLHLALTYKRGDLIELDSSKEVMTGFMISNQQGEPALFDDTAYITDLSVMSRSGAFATHLPAGSALVVESTARLSRAGTREFLVIREIGAGSELVHALELDDAGAQLSFANLVALDPPSVRHGGVLFDNDIVLENLDRRLWRAPLLQAEVRRPQLGLFADYLQGLAGNALSVEVREPWLVVHPRGASNDRNAQARVREAFSQMLAPTDVLDVRVQLSQAGREAIVGRVPVRVGSSCSMVIGIEEFEHLDYDVEVAQFAATEDPQIYTSIDGLALFLDPLVESNGALSMRVRGAGHLLLEREETDLGGAVPARIDQSVYAHLFVNESVSLNAVGDGTWTRVFGQSLDDGAGEGDLSLRIDVKRP